ncbi:MAG: efflux RND transporter permease subunit [Longimicrobiales bacterium]
MTRDESAHRFGRLCRLIPKQYLTILVVAAALSGVGGYLTSKLTLESDLAALLPNSIPSVQALERMQEEVSGGVSKIRLVLESQDFDALLRFAGDLQERLPESEYVRYAEYRNEVAFYQKNALLFLEPAELDSLRSAIEGVIEEEKQALNPFLVDDLFGGGSDEAEGDSDLQTWEDKYKSQEPKPYYTNPDSTVLVMEIFPAQENVSNSVGAAMIASVREIVTAAGPTSYAPDMQVFYGGNIKNRIDEFEALKSDIFGTGIYGLTGVFLVLLLYFRSLLPPILIALSLIASLTWTFGLTYLAVGELNTITGFLFVVLFGLGIDYGIHVFARYRESRQAGLDREASLHAVVCETGRALGTTTLTTSVAFFSLMFMDFKGFSELGLITGLGLIFALAAMVFLLPALIVATEKIGLLRIAPVENKTLTFDPEPFRPARRMLLFGGLATAVAVLAFSQVEFEYDFTELRIITAERQASGERMAGVFTRSESPALVLADSPEEAQAVLSHVEALIETDTLTPTVDQVRSVYTILPDDQESRLEKIRGIRTLLVEENAEELLSGEDLDRLHRLQEYLEVDQAVTFEDVPETEIRPFLNREGELGSFVFIYPGVALRDGRNSIRFAEDIGSITLPSGKVLHAASANLIVADLLRMVIREGKLAIVFSLIAVFFILLLDLRDLRQTLLVMSPLVLGLVWMGGTMVFLGMKLNLFNMVVFPSVVGIGVDAGVHLHHRYRSEGPGSLYLVLRRTGPAVAVATFTTIVGYTGLMLATHPGLQSIGKLAVVGLSATLLTAILVLPALMQVLDPRPIPVAGSGTALGTDRPSGTES